MDYESRGLDICQFCGLKYNVGERIPRVLVHCGHTLCTKCISELHHRDRVRCPICRKLVKQLESAERLPLNINILYEIVDKNKVLKSINFDYIDEDEEALEDKICETHDERVKHFYCSCCQTIFCRECIKDNHSMEECFVVDLYEIHKMKQLH